MIIVLPFLGHLSYLICIKLRYLIHKFYPYVDLKGVFRRGFSIWNLFDFKDKMPLECKSSIIYYIINEISLGPV